MVARQFLGERGFDQAAAEQFGIGFAPRDGDALLRHLRQKGFTDEEAVAAGLVAVGRSAYDRFRGRLLWPIRESSGDTIGFGARRIFDDDRIEAKYLNTPETAIYKKSQVLYGIDLARRDIARSIAGRRRRGLHRRDGLPPLRRPDRRGDVRYGVRRRPRAGAAAVPHDHEEFRGEVIFTFDGDAAGQKAALRAFGGDQNFVAQTYVAVEPTGLDPCDLASSRATRPCASWSPGGVPLYRFVLEQRRRASTTSTAPTAGSTPYARPRGWSPRSATSPRSRRSRASSPAWSGSTSSRRATRYDVRPAARHGPRRRPPPM